MIVEFLNQVRGEGGSVPRGGRSGHESGAPTPGSGHRSTSWAALVIALRAIAGRRGTRATLLPALQEIAGHSGARATSNGIRLA